MDPLLILFMSFFILLIFGFPLAFNMGISSLIYLLLTDQSLITIPHRMFSGINIYVALAIPLFILVGNIMNKTEVTDRLIDLAGSLVGHHRGGLAHMNVVASMFFAGCTGSALSDVSGIGSMMIPGMVKAGYDRDFSAAITATSSIQGPIIPPSIPMVLYGAIAGVSIGGLLVGGIVPGILIGLSDMVIVHILSKKRNFPLQNENFSFKRLLSSLRRCIFPLLTPVIILGGIISGVFTPTEAAAIGVFYALVVGAIYKKLKYKDVIEVLKQSIELAALIYMLAGTANIFGWILAMERVPDMITTFVTGITVNPYGVLLIINIILLFWGVWMDALPAIVLLAPVLTPLVQEVGINPLHFGVIMVTNIMIGLITPPYGPCLFAATIVGDVSLEKISRAVLPFFLLDVVVLLLITYIPELVLFLPRLFGFLG